MHEKLQPSSQLYLEAQAKEQAEKISRQAKDKKITEIVQHLETLTLDERKQVILDATDRITMIEERKITFTEEPFLLMSALEKFYKNIQSVATIQ